ncbi:MAG TPA: hypothetical protein VIQ28_01875 [Burkholderiales bacterium]
MKANTVVVVQGGNKNEEKFPWMFLHLDPFKDPPPEPIDLVYFDYPNGKLKIWRDHTFVRGKHPVAPPDEESDLEPKVKARLVTGDLDEDKPERPSVLAFYNWMKAQLAETIRCLHVFSHGWQGGPIIWNTSEYGPDGTLMRMWDEQNRDPHDTDFRIRDFYGDNPLAGAEGAKFSLAFAPGAFIKLWGCVAVNSERAPLRNYMNTPNGKQHDMTRKAHLLNYLHSVNLCFPMQMARALDLPVWASPCGYGSEPFTDVPTNRGKLLVTYKGNYPPDLTKEQWWRVSWFFRNQDKGAQFYQDVLKARIDPGDFVEHTENWYKAARMAAVMMGVERNVIDAPRALQNRVTDPIREAWERMSRGP